MESKLVNLSTEFAIKIINFVKELQEKKEFIISNQIGRSGTSIGANISEAQYAQGRADFYYKLKIALKEAKFKATSLGSNLGHKIPGVSSKVIP